jgi:RecA/RadA recombinase
MGLLDFMPKDALSSLEDIDEIEFYDTGVLVLNFMIGGSMFRGIPSRFTTFASPPHVGKSLIGYQICRNFLKLDDENEVLIYDTESAIDKIGLKQLFGKNSDRVFVVNTKQKINIVENFSVHVRQLLDGKKKNYDGERSNLLVVIDSMAGFKSQKVVEMHEKGDDTAQWHTQKILSDIMPVIANDFSDMKIPVYITAHAKPKVMANRYEDPLKIVGVQALEFFSSNIYQMTKVQLAEDRDGGTTARCKPKKSRFCSSNFKMDLDIFYKDGIRKDSYLLELMKKEKLITGQSNGTYRGVGALKGMEFTGALTRKKPIDECMGMEYLEKLDDYLISKYRLGSQKIQELDEEDISMSYTKEDIYDMDMKELKTLYSSLNRGKTCLITDVDKLRRRIIKKI